MIKTVISIFYALVLFTGCIYEHDNESLNIGRVNDIGTVPKHQSILSLKGGISLDFGDRVLWIFSDTVLTQPDANGNTIIPNSAAWVYDSSITENTQFDFLVSAGNIARQLIPYNSDELAFNASNTEKINITPMGGVVINGTGYIFYKKYELGQYLSVRDIGTGIASVDSVGNATRLTPSIFNDPVLFWESPDYYWGEGAFIARDGNVYLAGCADEGGLSGATRIARVDAALITDINSYEYWEKFNWISEKSQASKIYLSGTTASFQFNGFLNKYISVYNNILSNLIVIRTSGNLTDEWSIAIPIFEDVQPDIFSITDVRVHAAFQAGNGRNMLISYSSSDSGISDVYLAGYRFSGK